MKLKLSKAFLQVFLVLALASAARARVWAAVGETFTDSGSGLNFYVTAESGSAGSVRAAANAGFSGTALSVPATVVKDGVTYAVTAIGDSAFHGASAINSVSLPEGVTSVGAAAFQSCINLRSITLPASLTSIGQRAFYGDYRLSAINIPSGVTVIDSQAFGGCTALTINVNVSSRPAGWASDWNSSNRPVYNGGTSVSNGSVIVSPASVNLPLGYHCRFTATTGSDWASSDYIFWEIYPRDSRSSIDQRGYLYIADDETEAYLTVIARSMNDLTKYGVARVYVSEYSGGGYYPDYPWYGDSYYPGYYPDGYYPGYYPDGYYPGYYPDGYYPGYYPDGYYPWYGDDYPYSNYPYSGTRYSLDVSASAGGAVSGAVSGKRYPGDVISVTALPDKGYVFNGWTVSGATPRNSNLSTDTRISFTMPYRAVTVTANFRRDGSADAGENSAGSSGSTDVDSWYKPKDAPQISYSPPSYASPSEASAARGTVSAGGAPDSSGRLTMNVSAELAKTAVARAKLNSSAGNIAVTVENTESGVRSFDAVISQAALYTFLESGVSSLELKTKTQRTAFDYEALKAIQAAAKTGDVTVSVSPYTGVSGAAASVIGSRPAFDVSVKYKTSGASRYISDFKDGLITQSIAYTPGSGETPGRIYAVSVSGSSAAKIDGSFYADGFVSWRSAAAGASGVAYSE
ncbi:MAG: leucine-rich repeat protein [Clostridiales bacterium]|jgi:uncharacterized repeat protein (TIGR02543 family)|nr:leucine-rich repeat protein [Clostridiales bacterium]